MSMLAVKRQRAFFSFENDASGFSTLFPGVINELGAVRIFTTVNEIETQALFDAFILILYGETETKYFPTR